MFRVALSTVMLTALATVSSQAVAAPIMNLSSPNDLTRLTVGSRVEIDLTLQGLPANDFVFVLNTRELFPSSLFQVVRDPNNSSGLTPGPILFDPSQRSNFNAASSLVAGTATGNFSDSSPNSSVAIAQNGLYYSFILQAISAGSGTISFDPSGTTYAANDTGFNLAPLPTSGSPLAFTITAAAVPEPSALVMAATSAVMMTGVGYGWRRRRRSADLT